MPPAVVPLLLVAIAVPAAMRAILGWPRSLAGAWIAAAGAAALAQAAGEVSGLRAAMLGDAHLGLAAVASALTAMLVALLERGR